MLQLVCTVHQSVRELLNAIRLRSTGADTPSFERGALYGEQRSGAFS